MAEQPNGYKQTVSKHEGRRRQAALANYITQLYHFPIYVPATRTLKIINTFPFMRQLDNGCCHKMGVEENFVLNYAVGTAEVPPKKNLTALAPVTGS
jgi:hypothetical protein